VSVTAPSPGRPTRVDIVEVSPRDGLQSEDVIVSTDQKVELIARIAAAGVRRIEAVSFVNPTRVPQMANSAALMEALNRPGTLGDRDDIVLAGLVLNTRGLQQALDAGVDEINVVVVASDTYAEKNQGRPTAGLVDVWHEVGEAARSAGLLTSVTVAASFGCPYEGEVPTDRLTEVIEAICELPPDELSLADSIGVAVPSDVRARFAIARAVAPETRLRGHFHNTRNTGLANASAAVEAGVSVLDSSLGGVGGCPFAPNATGNIPTEDLGYLLSRSGIETGVDLDAACAIVPWLEGVVGHPAPGLLSRAGMFPPAR
jgi:hydroxymethylglutaryl-CoA lyase